MPVLHVYGLPSRFRGRRVLRQILREAAADVPEMKIVPGVISVFFAPDPAFNDLGTEIIIYVDGMVKRKERTSRVRAKLTNAIGKAAYEHLRPKIRDLLLVEVIPRAMVPSKEIATYADVSKL